MLRMYCIWMRVKDEFVFMVENKLESFIDFFLVASTLLRWSDRLILLRRGEPLATEMSLRGGDGRNPSSCTFVEACISTVCIVKTSTNIFAAGILNAASC